VAIIAPHGGRIEPATSEIASAIAADSYSSYCFEGLRRRPHSDLHIKSTNFDEPRCLELISACDIVVAVHGLSGTEEAIDLGGLDAELRDAICDNLNQAGFAASVVTRGDHAATSTDNICNRGRRAAGVQLEITRQLRDTLLKGRKASRLSLLADSVRLAVEDSLS
jgi:phage replication-related protein YjqB (UPF0714/DUF867 family)